MSSVEEKKNDAKVDDTDVKSSDIIKSVSVIKYDLIADDGLILDQTQYTLKDIESKNVSTSYTTTKYDLPGSLVLKSIGKDTDGNITGIVFEVSSPAKDSNDKSKIDANNEYKVKAVMVDEYFNKYVGTTCVKLNDGNSIPQIGLGTFLKARVVRLAFGAGDADKNADKKEENEFREAVKYAIKIGYRHIDTAQIYITEEVVGEALEYVYNSTNVKREDIFITTKISRKVRDKDKCIKSLEDSLKFLKTKYIDLVLIHSPHSDASEGKKGEDIVELYKVLMKYQKDGKIKSIGVSNFGIKHLKTFDKLKLVKPCVNQIEISPFCQETGLIKYCNDNDIKLEAYTPISQAKEFARNNELLNKIAKDKSKNGSTYNWASVMLKWGLKKGFIILPKSVTPKRIKSNADLFGFDLTDDEMTKLDALNMEGHGTAHKGRVCWYPLEEPWDI